MSGVTYDLRGILKTGGNTMALWQGPGWARYPDFKTMPALPVQLDVTTFTEKPMSLASDTTWRCEISSSENIGKTEGVTLLRMEENHAVLKVESGTYQCQSWVD